MNDTTEPKASVGKPSIVWLLFTAFVTLSVHFLTLVMALVVLCRVVPEYYLFYLQAEVDLPSMTRQVLTWSMYMTKLWWLVVCLGMTLDTVIVMLMTFAVTKRKWLLSVYSQLWLLAIILLLLWVIFGLCLPIIWLTERAAVGMA